MIASPEMEMGLFHRGVILICEHTPKGSFGLLINKLVSMDMPEDFLNLKNAQNKNVSIRAGGPIQTGQIMLLHNDESIAQQSMKIADGLYLGGDLSFLQESLEIENGPDLVLCLGYSGWGAGALEREFLDGSWFLHPASRDHIFNDSPEDLWKKVLMEMGGVYASLSMIPSDLSLN